MLGAVVAGVVLGVASKLVDYVAPSWVGNSSAVWGLVAFLVGLRASGVAQGARRGTVALAVATASYYAYRLFVAENISNRFALKAFLFWMALALPTGAISGAAGAASGRTMWALPAGAFAGEAIFVLASGRRTVHAAVAAGIAALLATRARWTARGLAIATAAGVTVFLVAAGYRSLVLRG